jgi:hypothetical protein
MDEHMRTMKRMREKDPPKETDLMDVTDEEFTRIKNEILNALGREFNLELVVLDDIFPEHTALVGQGFAIMFTFSKPEPGTEVIYLREEVDVFRRNVIKEYSIDMFMASFDDEEDRRAVTFRPGYGYVTSSFDEKERTGVFIGVSWAFNALNLIELQLRVLALRNRWRSILEGSMDWVKLYRKAGKEYFRPEPLKGFGPAPERLKEIFDRQKSEAEGVR